MLICYLLHNLLPLFLLLLHGEPDKPQNFKESLLQVILKLCYFIFFVFDDGHELPHLPDGCLDFLQKYFYVLPVFFIFSDLLDFAEEAALQLSEFLGLG